MYSFKELDYYFSNCLTQFSIDCIACAVSDGGEVIYDFYQADIKKPEYKNFNDCTRFNLGEISELFIGILLVKLIEDGKISADDLVVRYIPEINNDNLKLVHLMTHCPELPVGMSDKSSYFMAEIIQRVTMKKIEDYAREIIFDPLNLRRTSFCNTHNVISPYDKKTDTFYDFKETDSLLNFNVFSTAGDLIKFSNIFLNFCKRQDAKILTKAGFNYLLSPYINGGNIFTPFFSKRGTGFENSFFADLNSADTFGKKGRFGCMMSVDVYNDIAIAILTNDINFAKDVSNFKKIANRIMASF